MSGLSGPLFSLSIEYVRNQLCGLISWKCIRLVSTGSTETGRSCRCRSEILLFRFRREQQWETRAAAGIGGLGGLCFGDIAGVDGDDTTALLVSGNHHP